MKRLTILSIVLFQFAAAAFGQGDSSNSKSNFPVSKFTIEPALGLKPYPISDALISNVAQWNITRRFSVVSYTAYSYNNAFLREFNYITTDYNYSLTQKFGIGTTRYTKHASHTLSLLAGVQYNAFQETLNNPDFEKVVMGMSSLSPDFGLLYNLKLGKKKYFFSYRMYLPLYPYPLLTSDANAMDANLANVTLEFGVGVRIK